MGKKIDLNAPRTSSSGSNARRTSHKSSHGLPFSTRTNFNQPPMDDQEAQGLENNGSQNTAGASNLQKKGAETAMRAVGVPKGIARGIAQDDRTYELADKAKVTIMIPKPFKVTYLVIGIFGLVLLSLMLFTTLFQEDEEGLYGIANLCKTVTVVDTDCDSNARNCKHTYDGEVEFEDYIAGVVAAEVGMTTDIEFYKVAAISARTYFYNNVDSSCTIKGNATRQAYSDVEENPYKAQIKEAVEETKSLVLVKENELVQTFYASACVVNRTNENYIVRYGTVTLGSVNYQEIPISWNSSSANAFRGYLSDWYSMVDQSNTNYESKSCPNNHDYGMSQIGALYLTASQGYDYEEVIKYYYGDVEIKSAVAQGVEGFINPTDYINCSSAYGWRTHPVHGDRRFHTGLDIGLELGNNLYAAKSGTVTTAVKYVTAVDNCDYGYGNYILIDHGDGYATLYAHIQYGTIPDSIYSGATVEQGEVIGKMGSTGCSTGSHLHYEVRYNGSTVDPADYLDLSVEAGYIGGVCRR